MIMLKRMIISGALVATIAMASGCGTREPAPVEEKYEIPPFHQVSWGETLSEIAFRYQLNFLDLAQWNGLASPDRIYAGQRLRLRPPDGYQATPPAGSARVARTPADSVANRSSGYTSPSPAPAPKARTQDNTRLTWRWPIKGTVERDYQPDVPGRKGIQISGMLGQSVQAASKGEVVYSGSGLPGYGRLIIVKHSDDFLSAYGYLGKMLVKEGDKVNMGQTIAELGSSSENRPVLHFEIRQDGKPVNPRRYLPS
jgi:lipoprotein NlpD